MSAETGTGPDPPAHGVEDVAVPLLDGDQVAFAHQECDLLSADLAFLLEPHHSRHDHVVRLVDLRPRPDRRVDRSLERQRMDREHLTHPLEYGQISQTLDVDPRDRLGIPILLELPDVLDLELLTVIRPVVHEPDSRRCSCLRRNQGTRLGSRSGVSLAEHRTDPP